MEKRPITEVPAGETEASPAPPSVEEVLAERTITRIRMTALAGVVVVSLIAVVDLFAGGRVWPLLPARAAATVAMLAAFFAASRPFGRAHPYFVSGATMLLVAAEIAFVNSCEGGARSPFFSTYTLLILGCGVFLAMPPLIFAPLAVAAVLIYVGPIVLSGEHLTRQFALQCAIVASSAVAGVVGAALVWRVEVREHAARTALAEANRRLVEIDRAKTEFFENIAHELRTPLTLNLAPLDLLSRGGRLTPEQERLVDLVRANALRLRDLVNDLLKLAEIEAGHYKPRREPVQLREAIRGAASAFERSFEAKRLRFEVDAGRGGLTVLLDRGALTKVVTNLLANALKYTDEGEVRLSAIEREGEIEIAVSDTGIGIPEEAQRRLFERFHRAAAVRRREGTGIGLALVKTLVEAEGGRITVESRVGAGTTFRVFLPLRPVMEAEAPAGAPGSHAAAESRPPEPQGPRAHMAAREAPLGRGPNAILVVEDDPELAEFLVSLLARRYRVRWAADGIEALEMARAAPPDLIVTDVAMPRMDGLALTRAAKRDELLAGVPVLILSAHADVADFIAGYEAGAVDYLGKPFAPDVLESKVSALLKIRLLQQSLVARERLAAVGQVTITLSHEVNNALTAILGSAQTLENEVLSDEARASVRAIEVGATRIAETLKKLGALRDAKPATYVGATKMIAID